MAKRRPTPSKSQGTPQGTADDAFSARILEFIGWARHRTEVLVGLVVVIALLVGGGLYWMNHQAGQRDAAASELERIQGNQMFIDPEDSIDDLRGFLDQYGGTPYAMEGRLVLAGLLLETERVEDAVAVLEEVAPSFRDPLRLQATILLATALEEAEEWERAGEVYARLSTDADFSYQRREATEGLARVHLARGDSAAAIEAYRSLLAELDADAEERGYYEMRLAELTGGDAT